MDIPKNIKGPALVLGKHVEPSPEPLGTVRLVDIGPLGPVDHGTTILFTKEELVTLRDEYGSPVYQRHRFRHLPFGIILAALFFFATSAQARLGETIEQCIARYGQPSKIQPDKEMVRFRKSGIEIGISFNPQGIADYLIFRKSEAFLDFTEEEVHMLLEANLTGQAEIEEENGERTWFMLDNSAMAVHSPLDRTLTIVSPAGLERSIANRKAETQEALSGF